MENNSQLSFKEDDITEGKSLTFKENEKVLLSRIIRAKKEKDDNELREATWQLARLYGGFNKPEKSIKIVSHLIRITSDKEKLAFYIYSQGQLYEKMNDHVTAIVYYRIALNLLPHTNQYIRGC